MSGERRYFRAFLTVFIAVVLFTGCSSMITSIQNNGDADKNLRIHQSDNRLPTKENKIARRLTNTGVVVSHFAESHVKTLITRPVSSVGSLIMVTASTAKNLIKDTVRDVFLFPRLRSKPVPELAIDQQMDLEAWENKLAKITGRETNYGTAHFLINGDAFFSRFLEATNQAEESINIRTYIFDSDDYALEIADILKQRSRDVDVRILYDGIGTISGGMVDSESMPRQHHAPANIKTYLESGSKIRARKITNPWLVGDHTKTIVFDDKMAFLGGMNIGREYRYDWHDMMVEISGQVVSQLRHDSDKAWHRNGPLGDLAYFKRTKIAGSPLKGDEEYPLRLLYSGSYKRDIYLTQLEAIRRAKGYIYIENAYFSDDKMLYELAKARLRGVDVRVILPSRGDNGPMDRSNVLAINSMLRYGIRVYTYPGMSHVKAAIYDGWACFGTANFDKMSFSVNQEINIGSSHPALVKELNEKLFQPDFLRSREVTESLPTKWSDHLYERLADIAL